MKNTRIRTTRTQNMAIIILIILLLGSIGFSITLAFFISVDNGLGEIVTGNLTVSINGSENGVTASLTTDKADNLQPNDVIINAVTISTTAGDVNAYLRVKIDIYGTEEVTSLLCEPDDSWVKVDDYYYYIGDYVEGNGYDTVLTSIVGGELVYFYSQPAIWETGPEFNDRDNALMSQSFSISISVQAIQSSNIGGDTIQDFLIAMDDV